MKARRKTAVVEAFRYLPPDRHVPEWMAVLILEERIIPNREELLVWSYNGRERCCAGDWILRDGDGSLTVCSDPYFQRVFEILAEPNEEAA